VNKIDRKNKIDEIANLPSKLREVLQDLKNDQLNTPYREGGWTVRQLVHHLVDSHINGYIRMKLLLTEDQPVLKTYDQDEWAKLTDATQMPIEHSLIILDGLHSRWENLLINVSEVDWLKTALHPEIGRVSLNDLLNTYAEHCANHVQQIMKLRSAMNW
jgi:uncharacterized damage-inducible protein DinB